VKIKDYYKILGVERTASSEEIRKAYYRLARIYHPDRNNGSPEHVKKFNEITEAYEQIGVLENRLKYAMLLNLDKKLIEDIEEKDLSLKIHKKQPDLTKKPQ
jgi:curved DNA-binding protein CbpA